MLNFNWLNGISIGFAKAIVSFTFVIPLIFALIMKKSYIYAGAANMKIWRNLKFWIILLCAIVISVYQYF